jgi:site-specific recombinase XerD
MLGSHRRAIQGEEATALEHADIKQTQRYLNITDEELRKAVTGVWERRRQLRAVGH